MSDATYRALVRQAVRYGDEGNVPEAIASYKALLARRPQSPNVWYNLALLQRRAREYRDALSSYGQALRGGAERPEEIHLNRAVILSDDLHEYAEAERELETALRLNQTYLPALLNLGNLREDLGRRDEAARTYERLLELQPDCLEALARYAGLRTFSDPADPLIETLRRSLAGAGASAGERAAVGFALGRALDACGSYDAAFDAYALANRLSRESAGPRFEPYDRAAQKRLIDRIISAFPARGEAVETGPEPQPIFVLGMFRSGSTLLEQLLAGHPDVTPGGELDLLPRLAGQALAPYPEGAASASAARVAEAAGRYRRELQAAFPQAGIVTDKRPDNFLYIGLIKRLFPRAKIVHTTRDPLDNCLSVFFLHLDQRMSYALDLMDIGHYYREYMRLMSHWRRLFDADVFEVNYDTLVRSPRSVMEPLLSFLGLEWDGRCLEPVPPGRAVRTASVWQVREPLYQRSSGRARRYLRHLAGLSAYLAGGD